MSSLSTGALPVPANEAVLPRAEDLSQPVVANPIPAEVAQKALSTPPSPVAKEKSFELAPAMKASVLELEGKLPDLSSEGQNFFDASITRQIKTVMGLQGAIAYDNQKYQLDVARLGDPGVRERWRLLKEKDTNEVGEAHSAVQALQDLFKKRIQVLTNAIQIAIIEKAILKEVITGHVNSFSISAFSRAISCYGASYRLGETKAALEERKGKLGIKPEECEPDAELPKAHAVGSTGEKLVDLSRDVACLKEEAAAIYEALRIVFNDVGNNEWPKKLYLHLMGEFNNKKEAINALKPELEARNQTIDAEIKEQGGALDPQRVAALNQEKAEIAKRWESIEAHEKDISKILGYFKSLYNLEGQGGEIEDFSDVYSEAFNLLTIITSHREQAVLANAWEHLGETSQRKVGYFKDVKKFDDLRAQKEAFVVEKVAVRVKSLEADILNYRGNIQTLDLGMSTLESHAKRLVAEASIRGKWKFEVAL